MSLSEFQSHNGAIAASEQISAFDQLKRFNPTMVRLLLTEQVVKHLQNYSFNPTMVRLLPAYWGVFLVLSMRFQSHNGAIAAAP